MRTLINHANPSERDSSNNTKKAKGQISKLLVRKLVTEVLILLAFCGFTSILTWPYVSRLRDAVVDVGDPYLIAWILWWDYHQTFTDPINLFHANTFYPLRYTLAFSEHSYGISVLFFPLYALGLRPLTVHAVALFMGFAASGYGAFRLGRTLTGSSAVGWVSGIIFAFIPYRFNMMSQVAYLFSPWIPLVFESLVLFVRQRTKRRAVWLGFAFFMSGISTISWFTFTLIPFAIYAAILLTRYDAWRDRFFWRRSFMAILIASLALLPFMIPYAIVSRMYGFVRTIDDIKQNSASPIHWLSVERRNKLWSGMGDSFEEGWKFKLFPGLLPLMFSLFALLWEKITPPRVKERDEQFRKWLPLLDVSILLLFPVTLLALGFDHSPRFYGVFDYLTSERVLTVLTIVSLIRLCVAYPLFLNPGRANLVETIRSQSHSDAYWLGLVLTIIGFCFSLGWNFFFFRICYELIPIFRSMRVVSRGAMLAYLGLALLSGLGVKLVARKIRSRYPSIKEKSVFVVACVLLLLEFNAAPLAFVRGESFPDSVTLKLKETPMRGGIVHLPVGGMFNYRYMLRAADHKKPLIVGTSGFNSQIESSIEQLTAKGPISDDLMTLLESVPTSYLVVANKSITDDRVPDYQAFLARALNNDRLRFINRFDGKDDLYAVVKTEPGVTGTRPTNLPGTDWSMTINKDPISLLREPLAVAQRLYRLHFANSGTIPRRKEFMEDLNKISRGVIAGDVTQEQQFNAKFKEFAEAWTKREPFSNGLGQLDNAQYVDRLITNAGISIDMATRQDWSTGLADGRETRGGLLLKIVDDPRFVQKEMNTSFVTLHYFAYLRRNPDDPPDGDLRGLNFWVDDLNRNRDPSKFARAFKETGEYLRLQEGRK